MLTEYDMTFRGVNVEGLAVDVILMCNTFNYPARHDMCEQVSKSVCEIRPVVVSGDVRQVRFCQCLVCGHSDALYYSRRYSTE